MSNLTKNPRTRRIGAGLAAGLVIGGGLLAAAPAMAATTSPQPAPAARSVAANQLCQVPEGTASILRGPVVMKVTNKTDQPLRVRLCGTYGAGLKDETLQPGETVTGSGQTKERVDLLGNIIYSNGDQVDTWGGNPTIGKPWVGFGDTYGDNWERFSVNDSKSFSERGHSYQVTRTDDQGNNSKWFQVDVKN